MLIDFLRYHLRVKVLIAKVTDIKNCLFVHDAVCKTIFRKMWGSTSLTRQHLLVEVKSTGFSLFLQDDVWIKRSSNIFHVARF